MDFFSKRSPYLRKKRKNFAYKAGAIWRGTHLLQREATLTDQGSHTLDTIATECQEELRQLDERAKRIIDDFRAKFPVGKLSRGSKLQPPPPELIAMSAERSAIILRARDKLRQRVLERESPPSIVLQVAPKLGKLEGRVYDDKTNKPVIASRITLRRIDNPDYYMETGPDEKGSFTIPLPPVPLTIEVSASGYKSWIYVNKTLPIGHQEANSLILGRGDSKKLEIGLHKVQSFSP
jgi:Carboxypeptidase regulatory-like domain